MSLINKMLRELDARRADVGGSAQFGQQIRAVPEQRRFHPAWIVAGVLAVALAGMIAWHLMQPAPAQHPSGQLPLRFDLDLNLERPAALQAAVQPVSNTPAPELVAERPAEAQGTPVSTAATPVSPVAPVAPVAPGVVAPAPVPAEAIEPQAVKQQARTVDAKEAVPGVAKVSATSKQILPASKAALAEGSAVEVQASSTKSPVPKPTDGQALPAKQIKDMTPQQRAENEYRKAVNALQQGKASEAVPGLELALQLDSHHAAARQALIGVMLDQNRRDEAIRLARDGVQLDQAQYGLAMILSRLQLEKGELRSALETLERSLPYATDRSDYQAFLAALLQRDEQHKRAVEHYLQALQKSPQQGVWWMGLGISLQAERRVAEAQEAFKRAKGSNSLSPELLAFVESRLSQLQR